MCFIRINPASAPLNPPGAAPTLTTIYDENGCNLPSEFDSPSNSLSKGSPARTAKARSKRKHRIGLIGKPAPAREGVEGTENEKKRTQDIADSLDLGLELSPDKPNGRGEGIERRREIVVGAGEPNRIVREGDKRLDAEGRRRVSVAGGSSAGKRRASVG